MGNLWAGDHWRVQNLLIQSEVAYVVGAGALIRFPHASLDGHRADPGAVFCEVEDLHYGYWTEAPSLLKWRMCRRPRPSTRTS